MLLYVMLVLAVWVVVVVVWVWCITDGVVG